MVMSHISTLFPLSITMFRQEPSPSEWYLYFEVRFFSRGLWRNNAILMDISTNWSLLEIARTCAQRLIRRSEVLWKIILMILSIKTSAPIQIDGQKERYQQLKEEDFSLFGWAMLLMLWCKGGISFAELSEEQESALILRESKRPVLGSRVMTPTKVQISMKSIMIKTWPLLR